MSWLAWFVASWGIRRLNERSGNAPRGVKKGTKRARQYEHIRKSEKEAGRSEDRAEEIAALALQGAMFRLVKGLVDHGSRAGFERLTGAWPGDAGPEEG